MSRLRGLSGAPSDKIAAAGRDRSRRVLLDTDGHGCVPTAVSAGELFYPSMNLIEKMQRTADHLHLLLHLRRPPDKVLLHLGRIHAAKYGPPIGRSDIAFAYLFGSAARGTIHPHSDIDVAVYFFPQSGELEIEDDVYYAEEDRIWADIDSLTGKETDLLVLNKAPIRIAYTAITEGIELCRNDRSLYWSYILTAGRFFEEYGEFVRSFAEIKARSRSLSESDRERLLRILDFIRTEMNDISQFRGITFEEYAGDSGLRRNNKRWIENIINALIDVSKIIIASEKQQIPQTYRETVRRLSVMEHFPAGLLESLSQTIRLRNILAHGS